MTETLADLPQITDVRKCQLSCIVNSKCGWWIYDENKQVCQLHPSGHRDCDMVRGTPQPDYEKCKIDGHIHWPYRYYGMCIKKYQGVMNSVQNIVDTPTFSNE